MLDNGLLFRLMISTLTTLSMYVYKKYYTPPQENSILTNELIFLFISSFIISFLCKYCNNSPDISYPAGGLINSKIKTGGQCPF